MKINLDYGQTLTISAGAEVLAEITAPQRTEVSTPVKRELQRWSQRDPRWMHKEYAPGFTYGRYGCLVTSWAMFASLVYERPPTPFEFGMLLGTHGAFVGGNLSRPDRITRAYPELYYAGSVTYNTPADLNRIAFEIAQHGAVIIEVKWNPDSASHPSGGNQHFLLAHQATDSDVLAADPYTGDDVWISKSRYALKSLCNETKQATQQAIWGLRLCQRKE